MNNLVEIMYMQNNNSNNFDSLKLSKYNYIRLSTGEILNYHYNNSRVDNIDNVRRSLKYLRSLINANFKGLDNEKFFTITYKENMTDNKRLKNDCVKFFKRLRYKYNDFDYISIVEPQERDAWHAHILLRFNNVNKIWINTNDIERIWKNGFVKVKAIKGNVNNIGIYLSAYLTDIEYNKQNIELLKKYDKNINSFEISKVEIDGINKKFIKGGRLYLYPKNMRIFRKSKGIIEPKIIYDKYCNKEKYVGDIKPFYTENIKVMNDNDKLGEYLINENKKMINYICYEQYNKNDYYK